MASDDWLDDVTRTLASGISRRQALKLLGGSLAGGLLAFLGIGNAPPNGRFSLPVLPSLALADDGTINPDIGPRTFEQPVTPIGCSHTNTVRVPCERLRDYIRRCGTICLNKGRRLGRVGCTVWEIGGPKVKLSPFTDNRDGCWSTIATRIWMVERNESVRLDYKPTQPTCCPDICEAEIKRFHKEIDAHEKAHRDLFVTAIADANRKWGGEKGRTFTACAESEDRAKKLLIDKIGEAIEQTKDEIAKTTAGGEPPTPPDKIPPPPDERSPLPKIRPVDCTKCAPARPNRTCVNGECGCKPNYKICGEGCCPHPARTCMNSACVCSPSYKTCGKRCCPPNFPTCCPNNSTPHACCPPGFPLCCSGHQEGGIPGCCRAGEICCRDEHGLLRCCLW